MCVHEGRLVGRLSRAGKLETDVGLKNGRNNKQMEDSSPLSPQKKTMETETDAATHVVSRIKNASLATRI